jgi:hypothetical protein
MAGRRRIIDNLRLAEPEVEATLAIDHFDGLYNFADLPRERTDVSRIICSRTGSWQGWGELVGLEDIAHAA